MSQSGITTILTVYRRPLEYLEAQIESLMEQSVKPDDVWIWYNKPEDKAFRDI